MYLLFCFTTFCHFSGNFIIASFQTFFLFLSKELSQLLCIVFQGIEIFPLRKFRNPLQYSCLENPMDGGAWCAAVHGVAKSRTQLSNFTFTFHFHALEKEVAIHSSVLAWRILGTEAWWAAVYGVAHSQTRLKWLSSSRATLTLLNLPFLFHFPLLQIPRLWKLLVWG